jgi:serine/threonine-protein kinase
VLDFGVSKVLDDGAPNMALTMAGTVLGSPLYMSPEQARGDGDLDGRTDIFAFGAILFEGLSGMRPYEAANFNALIVKIATTAPRDIDDFAPDVPAPLRDVVKLCLEPDRDKRVAMFETVAEQLMKILPDLEREPAHLPAPMTILSTDDPDATNALPIVRAGDRPQSVPPPAAQLPAPHFAAWQSPGANLSHTTAPTSIAPPATRPAQQPAVYAMGAAAAAVILALLIVLVTVLRREPRIITVMGDPRPTASVSASAPASAAPTPPSASIPMVNVDTLPMAAKPSILLEKGHGRLIVSASPGWCIVTVDGVSKGPTPLPALDLSAGTHHLRCEAPGKKPKTVSLIITEAAAANYKFTLD